MPISVQAQTNTNVANTGSASWTNASGSSLGVAPNSNPAVVITNGLVSFYLNDGYGAGNSYLLEFRPECEQALSLQGAADQVFETFTVRPLRPTWPTTAKKPQPKAQP